MFTEESRLLDEIEAAPDDSDRRLVYADWLEDQGDPRCHFVRQEVSVEALSNAPDRRSLVTAVAKLREAGNGLDIKWKQRVLRSRTSEFLILLVFPNDHKKRRHRRLTRAERRRVKRMQSLTRL